METYESAFVYDFLEVVNSYAPNNDITLNELRNELQTSTTHAEQIAINILKSREEAT